MSQSDKLLILSGQGLVYVGHGLGFCSGLVHIRYAYILFRLNKEGDMFTFESRKYCCLISVAVALPTVSDGQGKCLYYRV